jgi:acyl-CoA thioesterase
LDAYNNRKIEIKKHHMGPHKFEMESWISCAPFERLLNMKIVEASDGRATLTMPFLIDFAQGGGLMHGGALVSLADTAVVMAIKSVITPKTHFATISLETKFLYPVKQGIVTAKAKITNRSGNILQGFATVYNEENRAVLEFSSIFKMAKEKKIRDIVFQNDVDSNPD